MVVKAAGRKLKKIDIPGFCHEAQIDRLSGLTYIA